MRSAAHRTSTSSFFISWDYRRWIYTRFYSKNIVNDITNGSVLSSNERIANDLENEESFEYAIDFYKDFDKDGHTLTAKVSYEEDDENSVDEDCNNIIEDGVQVINYGLKTEKKRIVKQQASGLLAPTDWYVVKSTEVADYDVPANILSFRADVRTKSNEMETMIDNCTTVDELKALYEYTNTGTEQNPVMTRPLPEFPKEVV